MPKVVSLSLSHGPNVVFRKTLIHISFSFLPFFISHWTLMVVNVHNEANSVPFRRGCGHGRRHPVSRVWTRGAPPSSSSSSSSSSSDSS